MKRYSFYFIFFIVLIFISCDDTPPEILPTPTPEPEKVYIYSVVSTPTESESVSLKNNLPNNVIADISNWIIGDQNDPNAYIIPEETILSNQEIILFSHTTLPFGINDTNETIYLKDSEGTIIDTKSW